MKIRVRAIIVLCEKVLLIHRIKKNDEYWVFPGGGIEDTDESPEMALVRECEEELGVKVRIGRLFSSNHLNFEGEDQLEMFFFCEQISGDLGTGNGPEYQPGSGYKGAYSLEWIELKKLSFLDIRPKDVQEKLSKEGGL